MPRSPSTAIAIDSANLLEETRSALAELNTANELAKQHSAEVERAAAAHDRFTELVLEGGNVEDVAGQWPVRWAAT